MHKNPLPFRAELNLLSAASHTKNCRGLLLKVLASVALCNEDRERVADALAEVGTADTMLRDIHSANEDLRDELAEETG